MHGFEGFSDFAQAGLTEIIYLIGVLDGAMAVSASQVQLWVSIASVVFSGVLVLVTFLYWRETRNHTEEMRATREVEFKPILKGTVEPNLGLHNRFYIENTGNGAAHDVEANWGFKHLDAKVEWSIPLISPGQRHAFSLPFTDDGFSDITTHQAVESELEGSEGILYFDWNCEDGLGNDICDREEIDVLETVSSRRGIEYMQKDEQRQTRRELEDLTDAVEDIPKAINQGHDDIRKIESVKHELQKKGSAKRHEISKLTGISDTEVASIVSNLKQAGVVDYEVSDDTNWLLPDASDTEIEWIGYGEST